MTGQIKKGQDKIATGNTLVNGNVNMTSLVLLSMVAAAANQLLYKMTLNAFSSKSSNYGFFVSQFNVMFYIVPAAFVSCSIILRDPSSLSKFWKSEQSIFVWMGLFDSASSMLGTMSGAFCPGELQTILNQSIIPMTMLMAFFFLRTSFRSFQVWGSFFILVGAIIASSDFLFGGAVVADSSVNITTGAIVIYLISVVFSGISNVYKDYKMKQDDLDEVHTSTVVSFWQLWIGFLFLPILAIPSLGNLSYDDMTHQISDGYSCFLGNNPSEDDDCSNAAVLFISYTCVNFFYNLLLLIITKRGSAVLLVISQALSLPLTNIAFTIPSIMGKDTEPLSLADLSGLILVAIGFLAYSGFGFAEGFMVAQGPSGQMTYAHVETQNVMIVSRSITTDYNKLAQFLIDSSVKGIRRERAIENQHTKKLNGSPVFDDDDDEERGFESSVDDTSSFDSDHEDQEIAVRRALEISRNVVNLLREKLSHLAEDDDDDDNNNNGNNGSSDNNDVRYSTNTIDDLNTMAVNSSIAYPQKQLSESAGHHITPKGKNGKLKHSSHSKHHYELVNSSGWSFYGSTSQSNKNP